MAAAIAALACVLLALLPAAASAADPASRAGPLGANPCPGEASYPWMGGSRAKTVQIPSQTQPDGITEYEGTILRPTDGAAYPGARPVVVLQHGNNGNQCRLWWAAQDLAGHGYIALVWTVPSASTTQNFIRSTDATRSAIAYVRSGDNPYLARTDASRTAILGSSLGAMVASFVQGDPDPNVRAVIAFDNLVPAVPLAPGDGLCGDAEGIPVTPRVPALGFANDNFCGDGTDPYGKQPAFNRWREAGVPSMELVLSGFGHTDYMARGSEEQRLDVSHYMRAWLDLWLGSDPTAEDRLLATTINGKPVASVLSDRLRSAAFLPPRVDTNDLIGWFNRDVLAPQTKRRSTPKRKLSSRTVHRRGIVFRFGSDDATARFECRRDKDEWRRCKSPRRIHKASKGRHTFRARAVDPAGNTDAKPARWRFRVV